MKKTQLLLTNACNEDWNQMPEHKQGRYCDRCTKHIVDLTEKSDQELLQFFQKKKDNVCGRLLASQLNRDLTVPNQKMAWHWLAPFAWAATIFSEAKAIALRPAVTQANIPSSKQNRTLSTPSVNVQDTLINGVVKNEDGQPLMGVKIKRLGYHNVVAITDTLGKFEFTLAANERTSRLMFELPGYGPGDAPLGQNLTVIMPKITNIVLGGVVNISSNSEPLYIVQSGNKSCIINRQQLSEFPKEWIESIDILKDPKATAVYGSRGANGVVLIGIKKEHAKKIDFSKKP